MSSRCVASYLELTCGLHLHRLQVEEIQPLTTRAARGELAQRRSQRNRRTSFADPSRFTCAATLGSEALR